MKQRITPIDRVSSIVCGAGANGGMTFGLEGEIPLVATSVAWSVRSPDGARLLGEVEAPCIPLAI